MAGWRALGAAVPSLCLAACAGLPVADYGTSLPAPVPERIELAAVPFHPQADDQCGPAALATVLGSAGKVRTLSELEREVYLPRRQGSLQPEMLAATRRAGLLPYSLEPRPEALLQELAAGHPVVILQNLRLAFLPQWHYAVAVGYDLEKRKILLRSGTERRLAMSIEDFDRSWSRSGRWAFVALPPDRLPATAREENFLAAAAALERVSPQAARQAYLTALTAWPDSLVARIGLGNAAYRLGDLEAALAAYRQATLHDPKSADAWNNLALLLHERGDRPEAMAAARRAIALGGPRRKTYESTLTAIEAATPSPSLP